MAFKLVTSGVFDEKGVSKLLHAPGERGDKACSGTRNLQDNLSDLRAQVTAEQSRGVSQAERVVCDTHTMM